MRRRRQGNPHPYAIPLLLAAACGLPGSDRTAGTGADSAGAEPSEVTPAVYSSEFAFADGTPGERHLYLRLVNRTSAQRVSRDYVGWVWEAGVGRGAERPSPSREPGPDTGPEPEGGRGLENGIGTERRTGWRRFLDLRDVLPVPRAAWRILPGDGLRVLVGRGGEILELAFRDSVRSFRLVPDLVQASWSSPTGQRELLALAEVRVDSLAHAGLLYFRRGARTGALPGGAGRDRTLVLSDGLGNGLFVSQPVDSAGPATAWSWLDGTPGRWSDVLLEPGAGTGEGEEGERDGAGDAGAGNAGTGDGGAGDGGAGDGETWWTLAIPAAGLTGRLRVSEPAGAGAAAPPGPAEGMHPGTARLFRIVAAVTVDGRDLELRGVGIESRVP